MPVTFVELQVDELVDVVKAVWKFLKIDATNFFIECHLRAVDSQGASAHGENVLIRKDEEFEDEFLEFCGERFVKVPHFVSLLESDQFLSRDNEERVFLLLFFISQVNYRLVRVVSFQTDLSMGRSQLLVALVQYVVHFSFGVAWKDVLKYTQMHGFCIIGIIVRTFKS